MNEDDKRIAATIRLLKKHAAELARLIPSENAIADAVGMTREVETSLSDTRRKWEATARAEMEPIRDHDTSKRANPRFDKGAPVAVGEQYELVPQFKTVRSYNTPGILAGLAGEDGSILGALQTAIQANAVTIGWRYTQLKDLLYEYEVPMRIHFSEIGDHVGVDGPLIGEVKVDAGMKRVKKVTQ